MSVITLGFAALLGQVAAHGLNQVNEARPFRIPDEEEPVGMKAVILDLFLGSNFISAYGGGADVEGTEDGGMSFLNWVNGGTFYQDKPSENWIVNAAFIQRSSWYSSKRSNPMPSYAGLTSLWVDLAIVHHENGSPWSQALVLSPGLSSDFKNITPQMMRLPARGSVQYAFSKKLSLELGVVYTPDFVNTPVLPLIGIVWNPAEDWEFRYLLTTVTLHHNLTQDTTLGIFAAYDSASWMVGEKEVYGQFAFTSANVGVEAIQRVKLFDVPGAVYLALGGTFANEARLYDRDGSRTRASVRSDAGLFTRIGLTLDF